MTTENQIVHEDHLDDYLLITQWVWTQGPELLNRIHNNAVIVVIVQVTTLLSFTDMSRDRGTTVEWKVGTP